MLLNLILTEHHNSVSVSRKLFQFCLLYVDLKIGNFGDCEQKYKH